MSMSYEIDIPTDTIQTKGKGILTDRDVRIHSRTLVDDPDFHPGMCELMDCRTVSEIQLSLEGLQEIADEDIKNTEQLGDYRLAIVVSNQLGFDIAGVYRALVRDIPGNVAVFYDHLAAESWLQAA